MHRNRRHQVQPTVAIAISGYFFVAILMLLSLRRLFSGTFKIWFDKAPEEKLNLPIPISVPIQPKISEVKTAFIEPECECGVSCR